MIPAMKVLFLASPKSLTTHEQDLKLIYKTLQDLGHRHVSDFIVSVKPDEFYDDHSQIAKDFFLNINKKVKAAEVCIFETSVQSLGLGSVIYMALEYGKSVIILYQDQAKPLFLSEIEQDKIQVYEYKPEVGSVKKILIAALDFAKDVQDTRFNFFISPRHQHYLDWMARTKRVPRSVYLRNLIKDDMQSNPEFQTGS